MHGHPQSDAHFASALINNHIYLSKVGNTEQVVSNLQELATVHRALAFQNPAEFRPLHALWLFTLAFSLGNLKRWQEGFEAYREAVVIYRALASTQPAGYQELLAQVLNGMAWFLQELGRVDEALEAGQNSLAVWQSNGRNPP